VAGPIALLKRLLMKQTRTEAVVASSTVRPQELNDYSTRNRSQRAETLVARFYGTVKVAASRNAMAVAGTPLRVYRKAGEATSYQTREVERKDFSAAGRVARKAIDTGYDLEEVTDPQHPLVMFLEQANDRQTGFALLEDTQLWLGLTGNAMWYLGESDPPEDTFGLAPQYTRPVPDAQRFIGSYIYGRGREIEKIFDADRVLHFRNPNPLGDPYWGRGDLESCVLEADLSQKFVAFAVATLDNGAQPGLVLSSEHWVTEDQVLKARDSFERMYRGPFKAGRSVFLGGKVNVTPWTMSDKEVAFLSSQDWVEATVAKCFDMPVAILRLETAALATAKESMRHWGVAAIRPRCNRIEDALNTGLVPRFGANLFVCFDDPVQKDWLESAQPVQLLYTAGLLTKNEARREVGFDDVEGGDEFYQAPTGVGVSQSDPGNSDPTAAVGDNEDGGGAGGGGSETNATRMFDLDPAHARHAGPMRIVGSLFLASGFLFANGHARACCEHGPRTEVKKIEAIDPFELDMEVALRAFFRSITPSVVGSVNDAGKMSVVLASSHAFEAGMNGTVRPILEQLYKLGTADGVDDVQSRVPAERLSQQLTHGATAYLNQYQGKLVRSVSETIDGRIRDALAEGIAAGDGIPQLKGRVADVMDSVALNGSERIARTEAARAYLSSRTNAWARSGAVQGKEWLLSANPCPICETIAANYNSPSLSDSFLRLGQTIELIGGGTFMNDYASMETPPAHPGCRCSLGAVFSD
jgi:HK97 family phage portal protein